MSIEKLSHKFDIIYCTKCVRTTWHLKKDGNMRKCQECGIVKFVLKNNKIR